MEILLHRCISHEQSIFVEGQSILDNIIIASEMINHLRCKRKGKIGEIAIKIDISKTFDRVHPNYLFGMMNKMSFHEKWIGWMKMCLETINFSVVGINEDSIEPIILVRGLRQGDSFSPYLFILCTKDLTTLIKRAESIGDLHGVKVCKGTPNLSHLLFADDCCCFFFFTLSVNEEEASYFSNILDLYGKALGQQINLHKLEVFSALTLINLTIN